MLKNFISSILHKNSNRVANAQLRQDLRLALAADGCVVFISRLNKGVNESEDKLIHTFFYGSPFKLGDLKPSIEEYSKLVDNKLRNESSNIAQSTPAEYEVVSANKVPLKVKEIPLDAEENKPENK